MALASTVWMVRLDRGKADEDVRGTLEIEDDAVVFTEADSGARTRFPFDGMRKPGRVRGSPILMLAESTAGGIRRTAFYFSQPPPLRPPEPSSAGPPGTGIESGPMGAFGAFRRSSKRRHIRSNLGYLTAAAADHKGVIQAWVEEIGARLHAR